MPQEYSDKLLAAGKMDRDSDPSYVKNGEYTYALNLRPYNSIDSSVGTGNNIEGSTLVEYDFGVDPETLRCIGSRLDLVRNRVYWLVHSYDSPNQAYVLYYDYKTTEVIPIFSYNNILGFSRDYFISNIDIVYDDEFGDTLLWSGLGEPIKLNVLSGYNRFNKFKLSSPFDVGDYTFSNYVNPFDFALLNIPFISLTDNSSPPEYNFNDGTYTNDTDWQQTGINSCYPPQLFPQMFYQKPITPYFSPNATYSYDNSVPPTALNILEKSYEVCYKYVYFDGQESEWSPKSEAIFPTGLTSLIFDDGGDVVEVDYDNPSSVSIRVPVNIVRASDEDTFTEAPHSMIARVKIAIRQVPSRYAPNDWYQIANIPIEDFYLHSLSTWTVDNNFPAPNSKGTYYYNWDTVSYFQNANLSRVTTITFEYDGSQTLVPIDIVDASAIFYPVPREARTQTLVVNRLVWGTVLQNMTVTKEVYDSIADNIAVSIQSSPIQFSIESTTSEINDFTDAASSTSIINSNQTARCVFDLDTAFYEPDFESTFQYDLRPNVFLQTNGLSNPFFSFTAVGVVSGGLTAAGYADMEAFFQDVFAVAYLPFTSIATLDVSFNEGTSQLTLDFTLTGATEVTVINTANLFSNPVSFFLEIDALPVRTVKNHSQQQIAFAFQDDAGRVTPAITGEWGKVTSGHFIDGSDPTFDVINIANIADMITPNEAKVMHILRKRSGSYRNYVQFALSKGNCLPQSWNRIAPYYIGFLDLSLDEFDSSSFQAEPENLYISLNSITGGAGGSYDVLRERAPRTRVVSSDFGVFIEGGRWDRSNGRVPGVANVQRPDSPSLNRGGVVNTPTIRPDDIESEIFIDETAVRYIPTTGDAVRFLYRMDSGGAIIETYSQAFSIISYNETWNTVVLNFNEVEEKEPDLAAYLSANNAAAAGGTLSVRILAEIIKPTTQSDNEWLWECAAQLSCSNGVVEISSVADTIDIFGDAYIKPRGNSIVYTGSTMIVQNFTVLDMNYNDFYPSANNGEGRPNAIIDSVQKRADYQSSSVSGNLLIHSEKSIQNTDVRRYGTVYDRNIQELDSSFGIIEELQSEGDKISIYQEDKMAFAFMERAMTTELSGGERVITSSTPVISDIVYSSFNGGISRDGSTFASSGYRSYFTDSKRGAVYRKSMDGITIISDVGMSGEFKKLFASIRQSYKEPILRGIVNDVFEEYILHANYSKKFEVQVFNVVAGFATFTLPEELTDGSRPVYFSESSFYADVNETNPYAPKFYEVVNRTGDNVVFYPDVPSLEDGDTIVVEFMVSQVFVFSEKAQGWSFYLSYCAEWASAGIQSYHTFIDGQMWFHNIENTNYNTFHDRMFDSELEVVDGDGKTNQWITVGVKANQQPEAIEVTTSLDKESMIPQTYFKGLEGTFWAPFLRDSNSTGGLYRGDYLKGRWIKVRLKFGAYTVNEDRLRVFGAAFNKVKSDFTI
jgi:hypothetical protein